MYVSVYRPRWIKQKSCHLHVWCIYFGFLWYWACGQYRLAHVSQNNSLMQHKCSLCVVTQTVFNSCSHGSWWHSIVSHFRKPLPPLSIIDGCCCDEGQGNALVRSLRLLLSGSRSTFLDSSQTLTHCLQSGDDQASLSPPDPLAQLSCWNTGPFLESEIELVF